MSETLEDLIQSCARELNQDGHGGQWPVVRLATGGSTSTVIDTRLIDAVTNDPETYKGKWLRLVRKETGVSTNITANTLVRTGAGWTVDFWNGGTVTVWEDGHNHVGTITDGTADTLTLTWSPHQPTGTALAYEIQSEYIRKVVTFDPASGTLTIVGGNFATAVVADEEYELHRLLHGELLRQAINDALDEMEYDELLPLTLITDGDMEAANSTSWTGTNATPTKNRTIVQIGRQSLAVAASAANGYAQSVAVPVTPGVSLIVAAPVYGDKQQAELVLYDVTNGADIETGRHDEEGWAILAFTATVPADCYEVAARLRTKTNGGTTYWNFVALLKANELVYPAPSWLEKAGDFDGLAELPLGSGLTSDNARNAYAMWDNPVAHVHSLGTVRADRAVVPLRVQLTHEPPRGPVLVLGRRNYPSLTLDVDTTAADGKVVKAAALYHAYARLGRDYERERTYWGYQWGQLRRADRGGSDTKLVSSYGT